MKEVNVKCVISVVIKISKLNLMRYLFSSEWQRLKTIMPTGCAEMGTRYGFDGV